MKKVIQIKFFDNDFGSQALGTMRAMALCVDLEKADKKDILREFKNIIHTLANLRKITHDDTWPDVEPEYFDKCKIEILDYLPKEWFNSESVVYDFNDGESHLL